MNILTERQPDRSRSVRFTVKTERMFGQNIRQTNLRPPLTGSDIKMDVG